MPTQIGDENVQKTQRIVYYHVPGSEIWRILDQARVLWAVCNIEDPGFVPKNTKYQMFLARPEEDNEIIAVGCIVRGRGAGWVMRADAVNGAYRDNGIHRDLIQHRLSYAKTHTTGDRVVVEAKVRGIIAAHNYMSAGFRWRRTERTASDDLHELFWSCDK